MLLKRPVTLISIHALREEGDRQRKNNAVQRKHFYPRPPRGGRQELNCLEAGHEVISIHALREEGDSAFFTSARLTLLFLSTPSARRATGFDHFFNIAGRISIHALREEGDLALSRMTTGPGNFYPRPPRGGRRCVLRPNSKRHNIFIHALREEGDTQ